MAIRLPRRSAVTLATAGALASTGTLFLGVRNLLISQADLTRKAIPHAWDPPPRADGVYLPDGAVLPGHRRDGAVGQHLMVFGDSTGAGYGCSRTDQVPGALVARALAGHTGAGVRLSTKAIVGATSRGLAGQVDAMLVAGPPPDVAVIMIGANDVTTLNGVGRSAHRLASAVRRLRAVGSIVVVGTCPDFAVIGAIPQPLRTFAHARARQLARAQAVAVHSAGGIAVPFAGLRTPDFDRYPERLFAADRYHPSAAGYALMAGRLIPAVLRAVGHADAGADRGSVAPADTERVRRG